MKKCDFRCDRCGDEIKQPSDMPGIYIAINDRNTEPDVCPKCFRFLKENLKIFKWTQLTGYRDKERNK